jgi:type II secretory pathway pseudopilin PulG
MATDPILAAPRRLHCGDRRHRAGLTLVEVMVSAAMIALTCTTFMFVFSQLNQMAMINRLFTGATAVAQSQVDLISTDTPFVPSNSEVPPELTPGTATANVNVYDDPVSGITIPGTMTTVVAAINTTYTNGSVQDTLYLYQATVTVTYTYRNRNYSVALSTLRTADI